MIFLEHSDHPEGDEETSNSLFCTALLLICPRLLGHAGNKPDSSPQAHEVARSAHARKVARLSNALTFHDGSDLEAYRKAKDAATASLFSELDQYIVESFNAETASASDVKAGLDALLPMHAPLLDQGTPLIKSLQLGPGWFLLTGVELRRGGAAIDESAFRLAAYSAVQGVFRLVDSVGSEMEDAVYLYFPTSPVQGETWVLCFGERYG